MQRLWPSDFLLWGSPMPGKVRQKTGRKPLPGVLSLRTCCTGTRPCLYIYVRWPWYQEVPDWKLGERLSFGWYWDLDADGSIVYGGWLSRPDSGERSHKLQAVTRSRDARLQFPLEDAMPYLPESTPALRVALLDNEDMPGMVAFDFWRGKAHPQTVGSVLGKS